MVDDVARKHFPMCMRHLHDTLRKDKHLKHYGRLQYGLFLKVSISQRATTEILTLRDHPGPWLVHRRSPRILATLLQHHARRQVQQRVQVQHPAFVWSRGQARQLSGQEVRSQPSCSFPLTDAANDSCQQILTADQPGPQDSHGCPYRHFSPENLQTALLSMYSSQGLTSRDLPEILTTVKAGHYHVACTRVFEITHAAQGVKKGEGVGEGESVTHPNQYAARSRELEKKLKEEADGDVSMA